ncbi:hypothetical protein CON64_22715 [Bacillus pseudomycoides]|nr:hypothetical protein CON64_22715 [Bacillus pseudomycoides]
MKECVICGCEHYEAESFCMVCFLEGRVEKEIKRLRDRELYGENAMIRFIALNKRMNLQISLHNKEG